MEFTGEAAPVIVSDSHEVERTAGRHLKVVTTRYRLCEAYTIDDNRGCVKYVKMSHHLLATHHHNKSQNVTHNQS